MRYIFACLTGRVYRWNSIYGHVQRDLSACLDSLEVGHQQDAEDIHQQDAEDIIVSSYMIIASLFCPIRGGFPQAAPRIVGEYQALHRLLGAALFGICFDQIHTTDTAKGLDFLEAAIPGVSAWHRALCQSVSKAGESCDEEFRPSRGEAFQLAAYERLWDILDIKLQGDEFCKAFHHSCYSTVVDLFYMLRTSRINKNIAA